MITRNPTRRGAALLLILAMLTVVVTACAALARLSVESSISRSLGYKHDLCRDLREVGDAAIVEWLGTEAAGIVLPPDVTEPRVEVLNDLIETEDVSFQLTITAWDQTGMVPLSHTVRGSLLRNAVPQSLLRTIDDSSSEESPNIFNAPGLDQFDFDNVFPKPRSGEPVGFGTTVTATTNNRVALEPYAIFLGAFVATHNPYVPIERKQRVRKEPSAINVNTAPLPLIEAAMRMAGRRGLDQIEEARRRGEQAQISNETFGEPIANAPRLSTTSNVWAFRIDAAAGTVQRSWWSVFVCDRRTWTCVQRLDIPR